MLNPQKYWYAASQIYSLYSSQGYEKAMNNSKFSSGFTRKCPISIVQINHLRWEATKSYSLEQYFQQTKHWNSQRDTPAPTDIMSCLQMYFLQRHILNSLTHPHVTRTGTAKTGTYSAQHPRFWSRQPHIHSIPFSRESRLKKKPQTKPKPKKPLQPHVRKVTIFTIRR